MIHIRRGQINTVVLTLSERTTIENANYLFEFTDDQSGNIKCFIAQDASQNKIRYNQFLIEESNTEDTLHGKVTLAELGYSKYKIYEQASASNLDPEQAGAVVEIGKLKVEDSPEVTPVFTETQTNFAVFNG